MKKLLLAAVALGAVTLARPAPAAAHFSLAIGLPGFGLFVQEPLPPPVVYTAPSITGRPSTTPRRTTRVRAATTTGGTSTTATGTEPGSSPNAERPIGPPRLCRLAKGDTNE